MAWYENRLDEASTDIALGGVIVGGPSGAVLVGLTDLDSDGWPDPPGSSYVVMGDRPCGGEAESLHWYPNQLNEEPPGFAAPAPIAELEMAFVEVGSDPNDPASTPVPEPGAGMSALAALATLAAIRLRHG